MRPVVVSLGRRPTGRIRRWWHRLARTWTAKPISTPQMLALQAAGRDPIAYLSALVPILRAIFPWRRRYWLTGDPVRVLLTLPDEVRRKVLDALLTVPEEADAEPDDPLDIIRRAQRRAVYGDAGPRGGGPTLATASRTVRVAYGDSWYYDPSRWLTSDGYAPFALTWVEYVGLQALDAQRRLEVADGVAIAHAKDATRARRQLEKVANPVEVS